MCQEESPQPNLPGVLHCCGRLARTHRVAEQGDLVAVPANGLEVVQRITLEVQPMESGQYFESLVGKKYDVAGAWWSVTVDPDMFYNPLQHSTSAWNFTGFKSEEADRRLDAFRYTASPAARKKIYPELVRWFQEEGSLIIFSNEIQRYWTKPNVNGAVPLPSLELRFEDVWIA